MQEVEQQRFGKCGDDGIDEDMSGEYAIRIGCVAIVESANKDDPTDQNAIEAICCDANKDVRRVWGKMEAEAEQAGVIEEIYDRGKSGEGCAVGLLVCCYELGKW